MKTTTTTNLVRQALGLLFILLLIVNYSCNDVDLDPKLIGTKWKLEGFGNYQSNNFRMAKPSEGDSFVLIFDNNRIWNGVTSTNKINGNYIMDGNKINLSIEIMTEINEFFDGLEYIEAIEDVHSYELLDKKLILNYGEAKYLLKSFKLLFS